MIIHQMAENLTKSGTCIIPKNCPLCAGETRIQQENDSRVLICTNPEGQAKKIKTFAHFVSRDALNIEGLSENTVERLVDAGCVHDFTDLFNLEAHKDVIVNLEGFGEKPYENFVAATEKAKDTTLARITYSLGINGVGLSNAKLICKALGQDAEAIMAADMESLTGIEGVGEVPAADVISFLGQEKNRELNRKLVALCRLAEETTTESPITGKAFVITGSVEHFANRNELKDYIESLGGKVVGSVSAKTDYLINNDATSGSTKNKTAQKLGIPILTEEAFLALINGN